MPSSRPATSARGRRPAVPVDAGQHAQRIAEAVDTAWSSQHSSGTDLHIPVSVTAALALCGRKDPAGPDPAEIAARLDPAGLARLLRHLWRGFVTGRPDLAVRVTPLVEWLWDNPSDWQLDGAHAVARAALRTGVMQLTDDVDRRRDVDLFGALLQTLRSHRTKAGRGEFYTPQPIAEVLNHIMLGEQLMFELADASRESSGRSLLEPAAGTGAMLCAAARVLRRRGEDPTTWTWCANEINPLTAACLAVNVHLWGLGPNVLIGCGDGLDPGWMDRARRERTDGIVGLQVAQLTALLRPLTAAGEEDLAA